MRFRRPGLLALLLCFTLQGQAAAVPEWFRVFSEPVRATALIGKQIVHPDSGPVGSVADLLVDLAHNRVHYASIGTRGYPIQALRLPRGRERLWLEEVHWMPALPEAMRVVRASQLLGREFVDATGEARGTLVDFVLDVFDGGVAFALAAFQGSALLHPVPLDAFVLRGGGERLVLNLDRRRLAPACGMTPAVLDERILDRPFLRAHARYAHQLTPLPR